MDLELGLPEWVEDDRMKKRGWSTSLFIWMDEGLF
jgi:hypothetical protein